jgi:hypothetical protein
MKFDVKEVLHELIILKLNKEDVNKLLGFSLIFLIWGLPVVLANIYHQDDIYRALTGNYDWYGLGRPIAQEALRILSTSGLVLLDVAPLTQIAALFFLALSSFFVYRYFKKEYQVKLTLVSCVLFLNPYLLYNLFYRFDSTGMALGILLAVVAFVIPRTAKVRLIVSSLSLVACLASYQPVANLFIALVAIELLIVSSKINFRTALSILLNRVVAFVLGYLFYFLTVGLIVGSRTNRASIIGLNIDGFSAAINNIIKFTTYSFNLYTLPSFFVGIVFIIFIGLFSSRKHFKLMSINTFALILALLIGAVSTFGPLLILNNSLVHFRTVPTAFVFFSIFIVFFTLNKPKLDYLAILPIFLSISFSYQVGNTYKTQNQFDQVLVNNIAFELSKIGHGYNDIIVTGSNSVDFYAKNAITENSLIKAFVKPVKSWQLDGMLIRAGVEKLHFLWGGEKRKKIAKLKEQLCSETTTIFTSTKFKIYRSKNLIHVDVNEGMYSLCKG